MQSKPVKNTLEKDSMIWASLVAQFYSRKVESI